MNEFLATIGTLHTQLLDPSRLPIALAAIVLTMVAGMITGPLGGNAGPMLWQALDLVFGRFGAKLDRRQRTMPDLAFRGFVLSVLVLAISAAIGFGFARAAQAFTLYNITEIILLSLLLTSGTVWFALLRLYFALSQKKRSPGAYYTISRTTRTDLSGSDDYGITRTGMAMTARTFDKGMVAPVIWYLIAGLPAAALYAGAAMLAWRFGKDGFTKGFGIIPNTLERLMGAVPSIFAGCLMALAGILTPTGGMTRALVGLATMKGRASYVEGSLPVTAMAYALKVSLGGPSTDLDGSALQRRWVGPDGATARLDANHLRRALYLSLMAHLLFMAALVAAMIYGGVLFAGLSLQDFTDN